MRKQVGVVLGLMLAAANSQATTVFTDWTSVDSSTDSASGTLGAISASISGGDISFATLDGSAAVFANAAFFTPAVPLGDYVEITGSFTATFTYTITLSTPVTNPILHVGSLASVMTFPGVTLTKLSGEPEFVVLGSTATGQSPLVSGGFDRNGTILLNGTFSTITFTVDALGQFTGNRDGIALQLGADSTAVPEPAAGTLVGAGLVALCGLWFRRGPAS